VIINSSRSATAAAVNSEIWALHGIRAARLYKVQSSTLRILQLVIINRSSSATAAAVNSEIWALHLMRAARLYKVHSFNTTNTKTRNYK